MRNLIKLSLIYVATIIFVAGCFVRTRPGIVVYNEPAYIEVAPPPPRVEVIGVAPYPSHVWIDGYWVWSGADYQWRSGSWEAPRPGYRWVPKSWHKEKQGNKHGWKSKGGRWGPR